MDDERAERELDFERTRSSDMKVSLQLGKQEGRLEGLQQGKLEGRLEGVAIGQIRALQDVLGETPSTVEELAHLTFDELQRRALDLKTRFQNRRN